jgi:hypothetical protein
MITSLESSPSAYFNNSPSPGTIDFMAGPMHPKSQPFTHQPWAAALNYPQNGVQISHHGLPNQSMQRISTQQTIPNQSNPYKPNKPTLVIHPTPLKSRVETQIPIKLTLTTLPAGITKLHLPTHTISKPKLLAKPAAERSPDTLELYTTLVCTSAMQNPKNQQRAFERAAKGESCLVQTPSDDGDEEDENKPLNGGEVKICQGCITRERKRAARKKVKKVEEEESWHKDEARRVIVFNTQEIKDWAPPTSQPPSEATGDRREPFIPPGALQVDAPMRIACYCRHQNEKLGFQVIFTIKDFQDRLIAQAITSSIMITDDHKTHNMPPSLTTQNSSGSDVTFPISGPEVTFDIAAQAISPAGNITPFHISHSSSDLHGLQNVSFDQQPNGYTSSQQSQTTSTTMTPRNLSRQASPSTSMGPTSKKRKASGSNKVPSGLAMTKLETGAGFGPGTSSTPMSAAPSSVTSPYTPNLSAFPQSIENPFQPFSTTSALPQPYTPGPLTPNSNDQFFTNGQRSQSVENLVMHQLYSAPASAHPSRAPSPNGLRNNVQNYAQQQQIAQAFSITNGMYGTVPMGLNLGRPPTINKLIPSEGPKNGGIEVTCLGSGFCQGLEVMFGDVKATTTTFWGETSLVCLLPPSAVAGPVPVTFHHQHQQQHMQGFSAAHMPKNQPYFKYVDDDEQQIIRTALSVLGHKMTGKMEDVTQLARRIVGDGNSSWGPSVGQSPNGGTGGSGFNVATLGLGDGVEKTLLRILDLIDLDDSTFVPRLNLRRASGQTMLHLACSLGFLHFAAALLARGANPEPRDKGGFTPMHFAALNNHPTIVRRLMLSGADPTVRSLRGFTPSDMATSAEVLNATRRIEQHSRTRSGSSLRSRTSSATSLRSLWEPTPSTPVKEHESSNDVSDDDDNEYEDEDADAANDGAFWMRSTRRHSTQKSRSQSLANEQDPVVELPPEIGHTGGLASPTAAVAAFRDQLSAHIQNFQQTMQLNFPNLPQMNLPQMNLPQMNLPQMPNFGMMPTLPDYQAYFPTTPMVRRISNLVGNKPADNTAQQDYRWWALFSNSVVTAPPAYEDIFPQDDVKHTSVTRAAVDAVADNKCAEMFDQAESSTSAQKKPVVLSTVRIGQKHTITREQQDQLRLAHAEKVKRLSRDRNLFFIWVRA